MVGSDDISLEDDDISFWVQRPIFRGRLEAVSFRGTVVTIELHDPGLGWTGIELLFTVLQCVASVQLLHGVQQGDAKAIEAGCKKNGEMFWEQIKFSR